MSNRLQTTIFVTLTLLALSACKESEFAGSGQAAKPKPKVEDADAKSDKPDDKEELGKTGEPDETDKDEEEEEVDDEDIGSTKPTDNPTVVTAGSFSAWAEPSAPALRQDYHIIIEVKLPKKTASYGLGDLVGELQGTDSYRQTIGTNPKGWNAFDPPVPMPPPEFSITGRTARLKIRVPGAHTPLTKDTVTIRSTLLNEQQTLGIQFQ